MKPIGAMLLVMSIKFFILNIKFKIESMAIEVKEASPIHAAGT
tara:strand:+ start:797 stop:925 length:129 start_codon:yes stop_codon:yes gene_type:complete